MDVIRPLQASAFGEQTPGVRVPSRQRLDMRAKAGFAIDGLGFGGLAWNAASTNPVSATDHRVSADPQRGGNRVPRLSIATETANGGVLRSRPLDLREGHLGGSLAAGLHESLGAFDDREGDASSAAQPSDEPAIRHGQNPEPRLAKGLLSGEKIVHFVEDELAGGEHVGIHDGKIRPRQAEIRHEDAGLANFSDIADAGRIVEKSNMPSALPPARYPRLQAIMAAQGVTPNKLSEAIGRHRSYLNDLFTGKKDTVSAKDWQKIADFLGVSVSDINEPHHRAKIIPSRETLLQPHGEVMIVGVVSQSGVVSDMPDGSAYPVTITVPVAVSPGTAALLVDDETLAPFLRKGAVVFFEEVDGWHDPKGFLHLVETDDGRRLLRYVTAQPNGRFVLSSTYGMPETDVRLTHMFPVIGTQSQAA